MRGVTSDGNGLPNSFRCISGVAATVNALGVNSPLGRFAGGLPKSLQTVGISRLAD